MLVVGPREDQERSVNVRIRGEKENKSVGLDEFIMMAKEKIVDKSMDLSL